MSNLPKLKRENQNHEWSDIVRDKEEAAAAEAKAAETKAAAEAKAEATEAEAKAAEAKAETAAEAKAETAAAGCRLKLNQPPPLKRYKFELHNLRPPNAKRARYNKPDELYAKKRT